MCVHLEAAELNCSVVGVFILSLVSLQRLLSEPVDTGLHADCGVSSIQVICDRTTPQHLAPSKPLRLLQTCRRQEGRGRTSPSNTFNYSLGFFGLNLFLSSTHEWCRLFHFRTARSLFLISQSADDELAFQHCRAGLEGDGLGSWSAGDRSWTQGLLRHAYEASSQSTLSIIVHRWEWRSVCSLTSRHLSFRLKASKLQ